MTPHPCDLSIAEAGAALRCGALSAVDLARAHLERIDARNEAIGAFVHVAPEAALEAARAADVSFGRGEDLGPLHGIPFAIKDLFDVEGWPVRWGSELQEGRIATGTAPAVQRLLAAGAVPLGLVATYELATVGPDEGSLYPQPRNPWNAAHVTGGSSSGSAAAVAAGMVRLTVGTDTGGSVRSPARYCGVGGFKQTFGALPVAGVMALSPSMDHVGLLARNVDEAALGWAVLSGQARAARDVKGMTLAYGLGWAGDAAAHPALLALLDDAASSLSLCGARVTIMDLPDDPAAEQTGADLLLAEAFAIHGPAITDAPEAVGPMCRASVLSGGEVDSARLAAARQAAEALRLSIDQALRDHDALILPTTLTPAPAFAEFTAGKPVWSPMRTIPFNLTGHPALSVPMGVSGGLPMGLQIVGRRGDEAIVLAIGAAFEAATDHGAVQPPDS